MGVVGWGGVGPGRRKISGGKSEGIKKGEGRTEIKRSYELQLARVVFKVFEKGGF